MNLTALTVTLGVMALPLGAYFIVEGQAGDKWFGYGIFITGILLLIVTMLRVWKEDKRDKQEKVNRDEVEYNRFEHQNELIIKYNQ